MSRGIKRVLTIPVIFGLSAVAFLAGPTVQSAAASPVAVWSVDQEAQPTDFAPGSRYEGGSPRFRIHVINNGGGTAEGLTVRDQLPGGITLAEGQSATIEYREVHMVNGEPVNGGTRAFPCTTPTSEILCVVPPDNPVFPSESLQITVPVESSASATGSVANSVDVSSPGTRTISNTVETAITTTNPAFGVAPGPAGLSGEALDNSGEPAPAGTHPYSVLLRGHVSTVESSLGPVAADPLRRLFFTLPEGLVANPLATPRCTFAQLNGPSRTPSEECPPASQVGRAYFSLNGGLFVASPLYNLVPPPGVPAEFSFGINGINVHARGGLDGNFHLTAGSEELFTKYEVNGVTVQLWGDPSAEVHDLARRGGVAARPGAPSCFEGQTESCAVERTLRPFLTMPSACSDSLSLGMDGSGLFGGEFSAQAEFTDPSGEVAGVSGCERLSFAPTIAVRPESARAASPTGLEVDLKVPQTENVNVLAAATVKKVSVHLPTGVTVNPSAAEGLGACSPAQIALGITDPATCPDSSKVGSAEITTPLLENPLKGSVYLAEQKNNPFGNLLALYLVVEGEGIVVKLPGRVDADPSTGQLTATFDDNPQLPFSELKVRFNSGPRATLATPAACGTYTTRTEITSWASSVPVLLNSPFMVSQGCSTNGFAPKLEAGTENPVAGSYSPFVLRVTREDGEQNLSRISATLPEGLLAKLAGVPLCPEAGAATGTCPAGSQVGDTVNGVGVGPQPLYIPQAGKAPTAVYLAGAYKGAPYSLVVKVPAQAGPFDLGTIAVRVALEVDPFTAQVTASSDPLPQILEGIPVAYRDVRVNTSRAEFVVNPTSCDPMSLTSTISSISGSVAHPASRFQVAGCQSLIFKPGLKISLKGDTKRTGHPSLKAVVTYPKKGSFANISRAQVNLPHSEFLDQGSLNRTCTKPALIAGACPASTIYGRAKAWTPLLERPLEGPVYLVGGFGYKLPALVADLNGQLRVLLKGKVDTGPNHGIRNTFEAVPDAAVSRFELRLKGGKKYGLLENSENLCKKPQQAIARFTGQNGAVELAKPQISRDCKSASKKSKGKPGQKS